MGNSTACYRCTSAAVSFLCLMMKSIQPSCRGLQVGCGDYVHVVRYRSAWVMHSVPLHIRGALDTWTS